jgi:Resolvase, N terminal domain
MRHKRTSRKACFTYSETLSREALEANETKRPPWHSKPTLEWPGLARQDLTLQEQMLVLPDARSCGRRRRAVPREGRSELRLLLDFLHKGDTLVVTRIDRSVKDLQDIVHELKARGVALRATEQPVDTGSATGKAFLDMLGVFAEF